MLEIALKEKVILITGGGSGLGLAMAKKFLECGARVAICGRSADRLENAKRVLAGTTSDQSMAIVTDVRDYEAVGKLVAKIIETFGTLDGLVNNAGANFFSASEDLSPNGFKSIVDIVLHGTFNCTQQVGNYLIKNKKMGTILNIVTTYTHSGSSFVLPSACAKAGVQALTTSLAVEWATYGIRVNAIAPGAFPTEGAWQRLMPSKDFEEKYLNRHPLHRFGNPEELSNLAAFLMSDLSPYITGECITIDGGESLNGGQFNFVAQLMPRTQLKEFFSHLRSKKS